MLSNCFDFKLFSSELLKNVSPSNKMHLKPTISFFLREELQNKDLVCILFNMWWTTFDVGCKVTQCSLAQNDMSHVMRKPVYAICEQQRRRSACASVQSDQRLCCSLPG